MAKNNISNILVISTMLFLIFLTRFNHELTPFALPDASLIIAFATGILLKERKYLVVLILGIIGLDIQTPERSTIFTNIIPSISGEFTHIHTRESSEALVTMAPFQVMAWDLSAGEAYEWVEYEEVVGANSDLAGERLVGSWATTDNANIGFLVTSFGDIIEFHPPVETDVWTDSLISYILGVVVLIAVPGSVLD